MIKFIIYYLRKNITQTFNYNYSFEQKKKKNENALHAAGYFRVNVGKKYWCYNCNIFFGFPEIYLPNICHKKFKKFNAKNSSIQIFHVEYFTHSCQRFYKIILNS